MRVIFCSIFSVILSGCGGTIECNSSSAKETIISIVNSNIETETWGKNLLSSISDVEVSNIKTLNHDEKLDAYTCSAVYSLTYNGKQKFQKSITYDLSYIEDKDTTEVIIQNFSELRNGMLLLTARPLM